MKKFLLGVLLGLLAVSARAHDVEVDGIYFNLNKQELTASVTYMGVSFLSAVYQGDVVIPAAIAADDGRTYAVTSIGDEAFYECVDLSSVTLPDGITSIGLGAFYYCISLTSVTLPDGVTSIEPDLFDYCSGLTSITIPAGVTSVGERAFYCCTALATVYSFNPVPPTAGEYCFVLLPEDATLYVPEGSVEAYRNAEEWKKFKNIKEFDPAGISDVRASRNSKNARYDLSGRRLTAPVKGLNIVGGKKVMVK